MVDQQAEGGKAEGSFARTFAVTQVKHESSSTEAGQRLPLAHDNGHSTIPQAMYLDDPLAFDLHVALAGLGHCSG
ncbi:MAG: hypothetical protein LC808_41275 [Actinobacteria bacterium]|nr:hypothetical protein [Actinomycetota bacterium]